MVIEILIFLTVIGTTVCSDVSSIISRCLCFVDFESFDSYLALLILSPLRLFYSPVTVIRSMSLILFSSAC